MMNSTDSFMHPEIILRRAYFHIASRTMAHKAWFDDCQSYPEKSHYPLTENERRDVEEIINEAVKRWVLLPDYCCTGSFPPPERKGP